MERVNDFIEKFFFYHCNEFLNQDDDYLFHFKNCFLSFCLEKQIFSHSMIQNQFKKDFLIQDNDDEYDRIITNTYFALDFFFYKVYILYHQNQQKGFTLDEEKEEMKIILDSI